MAFAYRAEASACLVLWLGSIDGVRRPRVTGLTLYKDLSSSFQITLETLFL